MPTGVTGKVNEVEGDGMGVIKDLWSNAAITDNPARITDARWFVLPFFCRVERPYLSEQPRMLSWYGFIGSDIR